VDARRPRIECAPSVVRPRHQQTPAPWTHDKRRRARMTTRNEPKRAERSECPRGPEGPGMAKNSTLCESSEPAQSLRDFERESRPARQARPNQRCSQHGPAGCDSAPAGHGPTADAPEPSHVTLVCSAQSPTGAQANLRGHGGSLALWRVGLVARGGRRAETRELDRTLDPPGRAP